MSVATPVSEAQVRKLARKMPDAELVAWAAELAREMARRNLDAQQVKSQISRAAEGAGRSPVISLFTAWVRYQHARRSSGLWTSLTKWDQQEMDVTSALLKLVDRIHDRLKEAAAAEGTADVALVERATMHATARFLGFFRRSVVVELQGGKPS